MPKKPVPEFRDIIGLAKREGYAIHPTAQREVRDYIRKASKKGLVLNPMENTICATALFSAGIEVASERKANYVTIKDIEKGWRQKLMACPGNTPPHRCLSRTVLSRIDELRGERPLLDEMLRELIK